MHVKAPPCCGKSLKVKILPREVPTKRAIDEYSVVY